MEVVKVEAVDIQDAWFQCIYKLLEVGNKYVVEQGSYVGQTRLEFDHITVVIKKPYAEPYDKMLPQIPAHLNIPNPVANGYVEQYLPYLITDHIEPTEQYTYGSRIVPQIPRLVNLLKTTPGTNQAVLQVAEISDQLLPDPPCLRHIDVRVKDVLKEVPHPSGYAYEKTKRLIFYPYFRSWDLWGGFPANLAGIAVLQKMIADEIGIPTGEIVASSKGLHLYGYVEDLAKLRCGKC